MAALLDRLLHSVAKWLESTGYSPQQLEALVQRYQAVAREYPLAVLFAVAFALVFAFDVLLPMLWLPIKLLSSKAEQRAIERQGGTGGGPQTEASARAATEAARPRKKSE